MFLPIIITVTYSSISDPLFSFLLLIFSFVGINFFFNCLVAGKAPAEFPVS